MRTIKLSFNGCASIRIAAGPPLGAYGGPHAKTEVKEPTCKHGTWGTCDLSRRCPFDQNQRS
jgi:hypothetical protein